MEAFEKMCANFNFEPEADCQTLHSQVHCKKLMADGWRKALEWVKEELKHEIDCRDVKYFIDEELEE